MHNETIKKYLLNELPPEERNAFEQEMENDPFLKETMHGLEEWLGDKNATSIIVLEKNIENSMYRFVFRKEKKRTILKHTLRYASATCMIGALSFFAEHVFQIRKTADTEKLYSIYFKPLTHPDAAVRGENGMQDDTPAVQAYEKEDYFAAIRYYEKMAPNDPENIKNNLFLGISFLAAGLPKKAIVIFSRIPLSQTKEFRYDIQWYLALAYLKNKDIENARSVFCRLTSEDHYYVRSSKEILTKLNGRTASGS